MTGSSRRCGSWSNRRARCSPAWITTHSSSVRNWRRPCKRPRSRAWSWCRWARTDPTQWYGVRVTHRLSPLAIPPTRLSPNRGPTPQCAPDHLWDGFTHSQLTYRRQGLAPADFNRTYEYYGDIRSAVTRVVISQRVYRLLREIGVKRLSCEPIRSRGLRGRSPGRGAERGRPHLSN